MRVLLVTIGLLFLAWPLTVSGTGPGTEPGGQAGAEAPRVAEPAADLPHGWYARFETSMGVILVLLHPEQAPQSVAHFAALADARLPWEDVVTGEVRQTHYYDGLTVHKATAGRRFEAGDPQGTGSGAPRIYVPPEVSKPINFGLAWKLGLTRWPLGRISGAQFFITASSEPSLTSRHPCIGTVIEGREVVRVITEVKTYNNGKPIEPVTLQRVRIEKVGDPDPLPEPEPYTPPAPGRMQFKGR